MPGWIGLPELIVLLVTFVFLFAFVVGAVALGVRIGSRARRF